MTSTITYFEKKKKIYPQRVWGRYRKIKWVITIIALIVYYFAPWLRWERGPHAPDQAILIDMANRRGYFFMFEIWPQEVYILTGILIVAALGLFFVTSMFGRVWCGYFCFQTIWTDFFIWVERIVQGNRNDRMALDKQKLFQDGKINFKKIWKKTLTHIIWLLIGLMTGGAWVFYFNDAPTLFDHIIHLDVPFAIWGWILALTFSTYLMAGFAREQVCNFMCPYARFQSAMFDKDSLIITYDKQRGEPRGKYKQGDSMEGRGHCISCMKCVNVCPAGIDIREGLQMECIACGLCVDACNETMDMINQPRGLIRYDTERNMQRAKLGIPPKFRFIRPRTIIYSILLSFVCGLILYALLNRSLHEIHTIHDRSPLFVLLSDGSIRNTYTIKILNKTHYDKYYKLEIEGLKYKSLKIQSASKIKPSKIKVLANSVAEFRVFVTAKKQPQSRKDIDFKITELKSGYQDKNTSISISDRY
ncbi:MAG: cytochrome c oxidase accessory protein CcoG [Rickettsiales bacterium]|nr:cytochrome c oxidase accessory protein CcoG [Rickettsiales bacterium]